MTDGLVLAPGAGRVIAGYDVGAHVHSRGEELFCVVGGTLDLLDFGPVERSPGDWHDCAAADGRRCLRGGPGSLMHVPAGVPHAFANLSPEPARLLFQAAPSGHEDYFEQLAALLRDSGGSPDPDAAAAVRVRHDIVQLTALRGA